MKTTRPKPSCLPLTVFALLNIFCLSGGWGHDQATLEAPIDLPPAYVVAKKRLHELRKDQPCNQMTRDVQRLGERTLSLESSVCFEGSLDAFKEIVSRWKEFGSWVLTGINERSDGGTYYIKFLSLGDESPDILELQYSVNFPFLKLQKIKKFRVRSETFRSAFGFIGDGVESPESIMNYVHAEMKTFQSPEKKSELWVHIQGKAQLKSGFLYQMLPEKVLRGEAGGRIQKILENYQHREQALKSSQAPK